MVNKFLQLFCGVVLATAVAAPSYAADIRAAQISDTNATMVTIMGDITEGDAAKFRQIATQHDQVVVVLDSPGGAVAEAFSIGKIIRVMGFATYVPDTAQCNSACAMIWIAGTRKFLDRTSKVGFHAAYITTDGVNKESGVANALVGSYYSSLNLNENAIYFATSAPPSSVNYVTLDNAASLGIEVSLLGGSNTAPAPTTATAKSAPWNGGYVETKDWDMDSVSADNNTVQLIQHFGAVSTALDQKLWLRYEYAIPKSGAKSTVALIEVDCSRAAFRTLQITNYSENNMVGESQSASGATDWAYANPGSMFQIAMVDVCPK